MGAEEQSNAFLERLQKLSPKRLALLAAELERRLAALENASVEPIAVIGLACRMPGGAMNPEEFWNLLEEGRDAIELVPSDRWDAEAFYDPNPDAPGKAVTKQGGFVRQIADFDPTFFGISPREALGMDPQQRMLMEVAWEALEDAGEPADSLSESATGVYVGISTYDHAMQFGPESEISFDAYTGTGLAHSTAAGRLSYFFGLKGPNLALDTSCSSSAVAIHLACQSLRTRECQRALAGGVNAILRPVVTVMLSQAHMLAGDGRCKTFSRAADGFVRSEGCGILVLKRLSDAEANGDRILGVIRASAINHDGRSNGLTAPSGASQEAAIQAALAQARLSPSDIDFVETHGTGTVLGDAIELGALANVFGKDRTGKPRLVLGAVKTNVGHLEAAAGVAGVIKVLQSFAHEQIPANLHLQRGNENEALEPQIFEAPLKTKAWPRLERPRIAGVSSFGFSGTNAHIILEEGPTVAASPAQSAMEMEVLTVSAKTAAALSQLCLSYAEFLRKHPQTMLGDFVSTANACRSHFQHRIALLVRSTEDAAAQLEQLGQGSLEESPGYRFVAGYQPPAIAFLFTGQGSQFAGMGREFYQTNSIFRDAINRCDKTLSGKLAYPPSAFLTGSAEIPPSLIDDTGWTQPVLFAFEYALAKMWQSWGIEPNIVLGHSLGEYVAACIAGVFSLETALTLAYERGRLMGDLPRSGGMLAVRAGEPAILKAIGRLPETVSIAAVNGPESIVLSGRSAEIAELNRVLEKAGIRAQPLTVSHAFHSPMMDPMLDAFEQRARELSYTAPDISFVSNLTGKLFADEDTIDAIYWRRHVRSTVRFSDGLDALLEQEPAALLEIGPHPVLLGMARFAYPDLRVPGLPALRRGRDGWQCAFEALQQLYLLGAPIAWGAVYRDRTKRKLALPTYPFQRQRYWIAPNPVTSKAKSTEAEPAPGRPEFDSSLYKIQYSWLHDGSDKGSLLLPQEAIQAAEERLVALMADPVHGPNLVALPEFNPLLDKLCVTYILEALTKLGIDIRSGSRIDARDLPGSVGAQPGFQRLLGRLFAILEEDGMVRRSGGDWEFMLASFPKAEEEKQRLLAEYPRFSAELNFLAQSSHLADVLRGRMHPLEALFPRESSLLSENIYEESPATSAFNEVVSDVVRRIVESYGVGRTVRILETGAGTGGTTAQVLAHLPAQAVQYFFTDISAGFLPAARRKFAAYPFVQYLTLDLEEDAPNREIPENSIDLVLAANVVHATIDLRRSVQRLTRLLRPGGTLVLLEGIAPARFSDLTFGMTEGWSRYRDTTLRQNYPLLARDRWLELLREEGFTAEALRENGLAPGLTGVQTVIVARWNAKPAYGETSPAMILGSGQSLAQAKEAFVAADIPMVAVDLDPVLDDLDAHNGLDRVRGRFRSYLSSTGSADHVVLLLPKHWSEKDPPTAASATALLVLAFLQAVVDLGSADFASRRPQVWLVTHEACMPEASDQFNLAGSVAGALVKTARLEHPALSLRHVDLPRDPGEKDFARLVTSITQGTKEHAVVLRQGRIAVPRLIRLQDTGVRRGARIEIRTKAAYLVTGGFSGLGLQTAQWLVQRGAKKIHLAARSQPSVEARQRIGSWQAAGIQVYAHCVDVSVRSDVEKLFAAIGESRSELRGIVHSAGLLDDGVLMQQTAKRFAKVFAPKVEGGWLLHEFSLSYPLDFFVCFGSAVAVLGSRGQANYAAANAFLEALAEMRRQMGLPATTIAWGPWSDIGLIAQTDLLKRFSSFGMKAISPEKGMALFEQALEAASPVLLALPVDWNRFLGPQSPHNGSPLFERFASQAPAQPEAESIGALTSLLKTSPPEGRLDAIKDYVRARVVSLLLLESSYVLPEDQPLAELGLDSLMALELKNQLQSASGSVLPSNFVFDYPTVRSVATYLYALTVQASGPESAMAPDSGYEEIVL